MIQLAIFQLPKEAVVNHVLDAPGLREWFEGAAGVGNPDALLLALKIRQKIATDVILFGNLLPHPFSASRFFTVDQLTLVTNCLKVNLSSFFTHFFGQAT